MSELPPSESQFLVAAAGWLELGLPAEANAELNRLAAPLQRHPDVLEVRWEIQAALKQWDEGLRVAEALVACAPERETGWIHRAYSVRRAHGGGLEKAWDALHPAFEKFPKNPIIPYNLACYAALLGRLAEAWDWLNRAIQRSKGVEHIKNMALEDEDLKVLWDRIRGL